MIQEKKLILFFALEKSLFQENMGAVHSRRRYNSAKVSKLQDGKNDLSPASGYFLLGFKGDKIKVVNAQTSELSLLAVIIMHHSQILKEGWDRHLTYSFRVKTGGHQSMILLVADTLLSLHQNGWQPVVPMDMALKQKDKALTSPQATVCFKRKRYKDTRTIQF